MKQYHIIYESLPKEYRESKEIQSVEIFSNLLNIGDY